MTIILPERWSSNRERTVPQNQSMTFSRLVLENASAAGESHAIPSLHRKVEQPPPLYRRLGRSDHHEIMSADEAALIRLWKEKRGE